MSESTGERLQRLRAAHGMSLSELSRRSGVGKGTISELENDRRGARLDTLFALSTALGVPLGALLPERDVSGDQHVSGASVTAVLLDRWDLEAGSVEAYRGAITTDLQESDAHAPGVEETVTVIQGRVRVGPSATGRELGAGESYRYPGDVSHRFEAVDGPAQVVLLMHYPISATTKKGHVHDDR